MKRFTMWLRLAVLAGVLAPTSWAAEPFAVPAEISPPFRRDALPIDTDTMAGLSQHLTWLAQAGDMDSPPARRSVAQALALAIALNPESSAASDVLSEIADGQAPSDPEGGKLRQAKDSIWKVFAWLSSAEAGRDGNLLSDLLGDAASSLDPGNPAADSLRGSPEKGKWDGWVAPVTAFERPKPMIPKVIPKPDPELPNTSTDPKLASTLQPFNASLGAVLYEYRESTDSYVLGPVAVRMEAKPPEPPAEGEDPERRLRIRVICREENRGDVSEKVAKPIHKTLEIIHGDRLPAGEVQLSTGSNGIYSIRRNSDDMSGPGFILANSALTGIAPDAVFLGKLDRGGKLVLPDYFWKKMATLVDGPGGRLIVPAAAEEYLTALLAVEKPDFFLKYEVLLAATPEDAIRLCAMKPDAELAAAQTKFKEIKDKSSSSALGSYLANSFVRKRLMEISQSAPYHLSAKLLAIQGAGTRPRALDKKILAAEIFEAIDAVDAYAHTDVFAINSQTVAGMESVQEASRAHLDRLERYAEMRDRELIEKAKTLISDLRAMSRICGDRREMWEKSDDVSRAQREVRNVNRELRRALAELTGDPLPKEPE
jgi:hypothetical protein